ncbi:MAG: hypothetical protein V7629_09620 [Motiliproteus sp.]
MKKVMFVALGAVLLTGCNSVPEKPLAAEPIKSSEPIVAQAQASAPAPAPVVPVAVISEPVAPAPIAAEVAAAEVVATAPKVVFIPPKRTAAPVVTARAKTLDPRMEKIGTLINRSSGAKQVISSDNPVAHEHHAKAKAWYDQALHAGDKTEASRLLNLSVKSMYTAIRSASMESVLAEKHETDYKKLKRSVVSFMEQQARISDEKGSSSEGDALRAQVRTLVAEADKAVVAKQYPKAQLLLRESFEMLRDSIESMREGETLVRSLNFATKKDEYVYELERYKSQLVLVDVLLKDKRASSAYVAKQVDKYISVAEEARAKAESSAADGDHVTGIEWLEAARKQVVRALRTGGIFIPG